jgi:hypothetical protein
MEHSNTKIDQASALRAISANLFEMRDALLKLSQGLEDLQYETDSDLRAQAENSVLRLIQEINDKRNPLP